MAVCFALLIVVFDQIAKDIPHPGDGSIACERVERVEHVHGLARRKQGLGDNVDAWTQSIGVDSPAHYEFARRIEDRHFDFAETQSVFADVHHGKVEFQKLPTISYWYN